MNNAIRGSIRGKMLTMIRGKENTAENLDNVVEMIRVMRQTGLLSVERNQGGGLDVAEVYFQAGVATFAHAGQILGQAALTWVMSWQQVRFAFLTDQPRPPANIFAAAAPDSQNGSSAGARLSPVTLPQLTTGASFGAVSDRDTSYARGVLRTGTNVAALELLVPQKLGDGRHALSLPLTRPQRLIYMLIDGRRTISDICRCTRKSVQEVGRLLIELRERGLITV